jgi:hypothetical protein
MGEIMKRIALIVGLIVAATVMIAGPASAAVPGLGYYLAQSNTDSTVFKSVLRTCPAGQVVIGTGFQLSGAEGSVVLDDLIPTETSVTVSAGEVVGPGEPADGTTLNWSVTGFATCAARPSGYEIVPQTTPFGVSTERHVAAGCPGTKQLIGGGSSLSNGFGQISIRSMTLGSGFVNVDAVDDEDGYTGGWSVSAYAICADTLPPGFRSNGGNTVNNSVSPKGVTSDCAFGDRPLSAGWSTLNREQVIVTGAFPTGDGVRVNASEDATGFDQNWTVAASFLCATP